MDARVCRARPLSRPRRPSASRRRPSAGRSIGVTAKCHFGKTVAPRRLSQDIRVTNCRVESADGTHRTRRRSPMDIGGAALHSQVMAGRKAMSAHVDTVIVGGGQAGLSVSYYLTREGRDHLV